MTAARSQTNPNPSQDDTAHCHLLTFDTATQSYQVGGSHTYAAEGTYLVRFQV